MEIRSGNLEINKAYFGDTELLVNKAFIGIYPLIKGGNVRVPNNRIYYTVINDNDVVLNPNSMSDTAYFGTRMSSLGSYEAGEWGEIEPLDWYSPITKVANKSNGLTSTISAFNRCTNLSTIMLPDSVTKIAGSFIPTLSAFNGATSLTYIHCGNGLTELGTNAFINLTSLSHVILPSTLTTIGYNCFGGCPSLTSLDYRGTMAQWNAITKDSTWNSGTSLTTIHCTDGDITL